jgi:TolA-binding protein
MGNKEKAKLEYERIIKDFPDSSGAKEARKRLAKLGATR